MKVSITSLIQEQIREFAATHFNAPYGVITGVGENRGRKYKTVVFGRSRVSDIAVNIYGPKFILLKVNRNTPVVFSNVDELISHLSTL